MSIIFDFVYIFESACIKCVYVITHMSDYPLYVKYNKLHSLIYLLMHVLRENGSSNINMLAYQVRNFKFKPRAF